MRVIAALCFLLPSAVLSQPPSATGAPIVFFDIAGTDSAALRAFYADVFGWSIAADGRFATPIAGMIPGQIPAQIRNDPAETMVYFGVEDVAATLARIVEKGGEIVAPRMEMPGVVVLGLFKDPAGNRVGLVEIAGGRPKVP